MPNRKIYNPMIELTAVRACERVCTYCTVRYTSSNDTKKTRRVRLLCARVRRERRGRYRRGNNVRREEKNKHHALKDRQG